MSTPTSPASRIKLKRNEKSESCKAKVLSKINCKIGDHFVNAYINTGSSVSIASTELYRKLVDEKCSFKVAKGTLNVIDDSIPDQECRITSTVVRVIGKSKSINLVAFPNTFVAKTTLGIDFLTTKCKEIPNEKEVFAVPAIPKPQKVQSKGNDDKNQPVGLVDWILDSSNLKKPLYNILADGTADDEDLYAICAFMKKLPRPVSPIRSLERSCNKKRIVTKLTNTPKDQSPTEPVVTASSTSKVNVS